jgi:uncharacterized membrane protein YphA (DoxX/SURF4 family)
MGIGMRVAGLVHRMLVSPRLYLAVRIALALLFVYGGALKLMDPKAFARIISHYGIVPEPLLPVIAVGLPALEVVSGIALIFDLRAGLYAVAGMLLLFVGVLGYGVINDLDVDCGCFGAEELAEKKGLAHALYRDLGIVGAVGFLFWSRSARRRMPCHAETTTTIQIKEEPK